MKLFIFFTLSMLVAVAYGQDGNSLTPVVGIPPAPVDAPATVGEIPPIAEGDEPEAAAPAADAADSTFDVYAFLWPLFGKPESDSR